MAEPCLPPPWPRVAEVLERIDEAPGLVTLRLRLADPEAQAAYTFAPGQFNMLYLPGGGEVPISIVSDPRDEHVIDHTIRAVGRITRPLARLAVGDCIGLRGPYGRGWPLHEAEQKDVVIVTGGLGCAPVVSVINYIVRRRERFGRLNIVQGVKHSSDLIWRERYEAWAALPDTRVLIAADRADPVWPWHRGRVTELFDDLRFDPHAVTVMMCGPEGMMKAVAAMMQERGVAGEDLWLSMERNMQCGVGLCGHCQLGPWFVCRDGPVFRWDQVAPWLAVAGF